MIVIDNACPHASGNLSGGDVAGTVVTCPWHHWSFDLNTGVCTDSARVRVRRYQAEIRDGRVFVDLADHDIPANLSAIPPAQGVQRAAASPGNAHRNAPDQAIRSDCPEARACSRD